MSGFDFNDVHGTFFGGEFEEVLVVAEALSVVEIFPGMGFMNELGHAVGIELPVVWGDFDALGTTDTFNGFMCYFQHGWAA